MFAPPDVRTQASWYVSLFGGASLPIFGSEDHRYGGGFSAAYGKPEPKFRLARIPAQLVTELRIAQTASEGVRLEKPNLVFDFGLLFYARWRGPLGPDHAGLYADLGVGIDAAERSTSDLPSRLNTTPMFGAGFAVPAGSGKECLIGFRFLHLSNAGTQGRGPGANRGQNQLYLTVAYRF